MIPLPAIALLSRYWHFAAIGALALPLGVQTYRIASLKASHAEYVAQAEKAKADAVAKILTRERAAAAITQQTELSHEKTIADLRAAAAVRLQKLTGRATAVPRVPDAAAFTHDTARNDRLLIETSVAVALMLEADENTQQLISLQAWVREQQAASK